MLLFYLGGLATNLSKSFPCRRAVQSMCSRIQTGVTNKYSCLFIGGQWQTQKLSQSTKLFLWSGCPGDCGLKWKSDHCLKTKTKTHLTPCIVTQLKISPCSLNILLRVLTSQSTGNARIRYILIRAHKTLSRMLCCPGECSEQGTFTNSRSVPPLHHCWKKQIYEVKLYGCYILELLAHSQMRMLAEIARFPERNF